MPTAQQEGTGKRTVSICRHLEGLETGLLWTTIILESVASLEMKKLRDTVHLSLSETASQLAERIRGYWGENKVHYVRDQGEAQSRIRQHHWFRFGH